MIEEYKTIHKWDENHQLEFLNNLYLEIGDTFTLDVENPFDKRLADGLDISECLVDIFMNPEYLPFTCKYLLNLNLFPYQFSILDTFWNYRFPMLIGSRGCAKTTMLAIYCILRALLNQGVKIVVAGAGLRQASFVFEYMMNIWDEAPILRDITGSERPKRTNLGFEWKCGKSSVIGIPLGTGGKIRGLRANIIIADEFASISPEIFETVLRGFTAVKSFDTFSQVQSSYQEDFLREIGLSEQYDIISKENNYGLSALGGNQIIISGTASYYFNHFYKYYEHYCNIISSRGQISMKDESFSDIDHKNFAVIRIPYNKLPKGLMDKEVLEQGAAIMDSSIYKMEYAACFAKDSDGFYPASVIYGSATSPIKISSDEEIKVYPLSTGQNHKQYVMGIDPASERDNLAITIVELNSNYGSHIYTWAANRKSFEKDKKENPYLYKETSDYNTFIIRKIHGLLKRFNIVRIHIDANGGGHSIREGLRDQSKLLDGDHCIYDMEDENVAGLKGRHILKMIQFSKREWYEAAHYNLLKDLQSGSYVFPEYDALNIEKSIVVSEKNNRSLVIDSLDDIYTNIEQAKYQCTLIQEKTTAKGSKTWDLPKIEGVISEDISVKIKKDHFTSVLLACDARRGYIEDSSKPIMMTVVGTTVQRVESYNPNEPLYQGGGMSRMLNSDYNKAGYLPKYWQKRV